jgi:hypothetical protein
MCELLLCFSGTFFLLPPSAHPGHSVQGRFEQEPQPAAGGAHPIWPASSPGLVSFSFFLFRLSSSLHPKIVAWKIKKSSKTTFTTFVTSRFVAHRTLLETLQKLVRSPFSLFLSFYST